MADLMQQARDLLPCPFCGEAAKHTEWGDAGFNKVECTYCDVCMDYFYHQDDAFEAWNRRAALRAAPEAEALRVAMTTLEQIATTPRNKGARMNAKATLLFLQTQLAARPHGVSHG